jgi:hypothetical protein
MPSVQADINPVLGRVVSSLAVVAALADYLRAVSVGLLVPAGLAEPPFWLE